MPLITLPTVAGDTIDLGGPSDQLRLIIVYRGVTDVYKSRQAGWGQYLPRLARENIALYLISGDTRDDAAVFADDLGFDCPIGYDLTFTAMRDLGLYVFEPIDRFAEREYAGARPIAEPALFLLDTTGNAHILSISNSPFVRPEPWQVVEGLLMINNRDYPVGGTLT